MLSKFNKKNIAKEPNTGGVYRFYNKDKKLIYVGRASGKWGTKFQPEKNNGGGRYRFGQRHRLQSYYQKDDFSSGDGHPTKKPLRPRIKYYYTKTVVSKTKRRALEKKLKRGLKFNVA